MSRAVRVGDREYVIESFNGRKAILAGRMVARIAKKVPGLLEADAAFQRAYADANAIRVTRAMALATGWKDRLEDVSDEQWEQLGGVLVIPQEPSFEVRLAALFTEAFETAEEEVLKLLALAVIPNGDLADAAKNGDPRQALLAKAEELMDNGTLVELVDLAAEVSEQIKDEFSSGGGGVGKLRALWSNQSAETPTPTPASQPAPSPAPVPVPAPQPTTPTPVATSRDQTSSTGSPEATDGDTDGSLTGPPGGSSSLSVTA